MGSESKRRWFQIHLSTAMVLMFVAGGLVWANVQPFHHRIEFDHRSSMEVGSKGNERIAESGYYDISYFGWPVFMAESSAEIVPKRPNPIISTYKDWSFHSLIINLAAALAVLAATALACEYRIRRREARKP